MLEFAARRASAGGTDETEYRITDVASRNDDFGNFVWMELSKGAREAAVAGSGGAAAESGARARAGANDEGGGAAERGHEVHAGVD